MLVRPARTRYRIRVNPVAPIGTDVAHAAELLRAGEVVGMPTETVYGLAAVAFDERAVVKVFEVITEAELAEIQPKQAQK